MGGDLCLRNDLSDLILNDSSSDFYPYAGRIGYYGVASNSLAGGAGSGETALSARQLVQVAKDAAGVHLRVLWARDGVPRMKRPQENPRVVAASDFK